jgi:organizing structure protein 2
LQSRKPIYDDFESAPAPPTKTAPSSEKTPPPTKSTSPTPTDRLAVQIGKTRLFLHGHVAAAENKVNEFMDSVLHLEESFTSTIASLAPPPQSGEKLMPGSLYVLVAAMTGSIVSRNRNILLRATVPLAVGIGAGWVVLPVTMRNVSNLLWKYEQRFPAIADGHIRTREGIEKAWRMARIHTQQAVNIVDDKVSSGREAVEGWVKKGK